MKTKQRQKPHTSGAIQPDTLYSLPEFRRASGLGDTTLRLARRRGDELPTIRVGRRKYVRGLDGIEFIERLAAKAAEVDSQ
jgi:hypothetical protein